jgi:hypothetical protein
VLRAGVPLARRLSKWADLALTSNTRIEPTVAKLLSTIIRYALWAVVGFVGTKAYTKLLPRGDHMAIAYIKTGLESRGIPVICGDHMAFSGMPAAEQSRHIAN